jgi:hypothetical protein
MVYAYLAPYMYKIGGDGSKDYLGKRLLKALYQKQNRKYAEKYNVTATLKNDNKSWKYVGDTKSVNEFKKHQFVKYPSILDMIKTSSFLNEKEAAFESNFNKINTDRSIALDVYGKLVGEFDKAIKTQIPEWQKKLVKRKDDYYLNENLLNRLNNGSIIDLSNQTMNKEDGGNKIDPYDLIREYTNQMDLIEKAKFSIDRKTNKNLKIAIFDEIKNELTTEKGFINQTSYAQKLNSNNLKTIFNDDLILFNNTSLRDIDSLKTVYFSDVFFKKVHKIIIKNLISYFEDVDSKTEDALFFELKEKIGFVPNIDNVIRILMNRFISLYC